MLGNPRLGANPAPAARSRSPPAAKSCSPTRRAPRRTSPGRDCADLLRRAGSPPRQDRLGRHVQVRTAGDLQVRKLDPLQRGAVLELHQIRNRRRRRQHRHHPHHDDHNHTDDHNDDHPHDAERTSHGSPLEGGSRALKLAGSQHGSTVHGSIKVSQAGSGGRLEVSLFATSASLAKAGALPRRCASGDCCARR